MKKSTKAVLLSALVFPGVGHIFLKKHILGGLLVSASCAAIYYLITKTVERALQITEKIQNGDIQLDVMAITELVSKQPSGSETNLLSVATIAFIICWLIGIVDSYRVGCIQDKTR